MARRRKKRGLAKGGRELPSASDIAEVRRGEGSSRDKAEARAAGYTVTKVKGSKRYTVGKRRRKRRRR